MIPGDGSPAFQINAPGAQYTFVNGINNQGTVVGYYLGTDTLPYGFTYAGGTFTLIPTGPAIPRATNNLGDITGEHTLSSAAFSPMGINNSGIIVGNGLASGIVKIGASQFTYQFSGQRPLLLTTSTTRTSREHLCDSQRP